MVNFVVDDMSWASNNLSGLTVEELILDSDVASAVTSVFASAAVAEVSVTILGEFFLGGTIDVKFTGAVSLNVGVFLGPLLESTFKFVLVVSLTSDLVFGILLTGVAGLLLNLSLFLEGWDDGLTNVARFEVGVDVTSFSVHESIVIKALTSSLSIDVADGISEVIAVEVVLGDLVSIAFGIFGIKIIGVADVSVGEIAKTLSD